MKKNNNLTDNYQKWSNLPVPKIGNFTMFQNKASNLWVLKNSSNLFGFLISDTYGEIDNNYKNIRIAWKSSITDVASNKQLKNCLIIESTENIDSSLFCRVLNSIIENNTTNFYSSSEIKNILDQIEGITLKSIDDFNEVVGVWGELYLLNELLNYNSNNQIAFEIINSWEGVDNRAKIDFIFKNQKLKIEVKTTTKGIREHKFNSIEQLQKGPLFKGYLASFCINTDESGMSCSEIVYRIKNIIPSELLSVLEKKLKLRGKACQNSEHHFLIDNNKNVEFFDFSNVPKPILEDGISEVEWIAVLENKKHLEPKLKIDLLNLRVTLA